MSSKMFKRPSSARRNITQAMFTPYASCQRLRHVQSLLRDSSEGDGGVPDAVLCIIGIDSKYNEGSRELANFLLFGFYDVRRNELERSGIEDESLEDLMFLIKRDSIDVYCNPVNYLYLLPYIAHWRNLRVHCLTEEQYEKDGEENEEFKIHSLVAMVAGCSLIGFPYNRTGRNNKFDKMTIEKWPVIQAFALEGMGGGGFFTLKYEVTDLSCDLQKIYHIIDPVSLETLVTHQLPQFERQWETMVRTIDAHSETLDKLTEINVCEPLRSYYTHGRVSSGRHRPGINRQPFVLFGTGTSKENLQTGCLSSGSTLGSTGADGGIAKHMVCQIVSPKSPLTCRRTYFLSNAAQPHITDGADLEEYSDLVADAFLLQQVYKGCILSCVAAITSYTSSLSVDQACQTALQMIQKCHANSKWHIPGSFISDRNNVEVKIEAYDNSGSTVPLLEGQRVRMVKVAMVTVYDIPSVQHPGGRLGSVSFSETFMDSTVPVEKPDGSTYHDNTNTHLTSHIARSISWPGDPAEQTCMREVKTNLNNLYGELLIPGESADICQLSPYSTASTGLLYLYDAGLVFHHAHSGLITLPGSSMVVLQFYDGDSTSGVAFLVCRYNRSGQASIPPHYHSSTNEIVIALEPKSKAYKALFSKALHVLKSNDHQPALQLLQALPKHLQSLHADLQKKFVKHSSVKVVSPLQQAFLEISHLEGFMNHLAVSSVLTSSLPAQDLPVVLGQSYDHGQFTDNEQVIVTILAGVPGSHKEALCANLMKIVNQDGSWVMLKQPEDAANSFSPQQLQSLLTATLSASRKRRQSQAGQKIRVLVVTPGCTNLMEVVQAICSHPDTEVASKLKIGAVTTCIDPLNTYMTDRYTFPKLLDQCAQGWVNNIVFTSSLTPQNEALAEVQHLVRAINSDVALLLAENGQVTRTPDIELILSETAFTANNHIRSRHLLYPGWHKCHDEYRRSTPVMSETVLHFHQPLEKNKLLAKLRGMKSRLHSHPFIGNIYNVRGRVLFSGSSQPTEFHYTTLSGHLHTQPADISPSSPERSRSKPSYAVFTGVGLDIGTLQQWLRGCTMQKPERKEPCTRQSLTAGELKKIHKLHHLDPLPEGWFYNGTHYVSMIGDKTNEHPNLEEFITEYIHLKNQEIEQHNRNIDAMKYVDLFD